MGRGSLSLNVPEEDRNESTEQLITDSEELDTALAMTEWAFDAGRCTGKYVGVQQPQHLFNHMKGRWAGRWILNLNIQECY